MTDKINDKQALDLLYWLTHVDYAAPAPKDCTLKQAYDHIAARLAQQPAETACKDCNGDGKQCFAGHSAHPSNWHKCETCGGTGNAQQPAEAVHDSDCAIHDAPAYPAGLCDCNASTEPAAAEYTPGDYGMEVGATTHTPAAAVPDDGFNGDNKRLIECAKALLSLDADGVMVPHGIGGHARGLLQAFIARLPAQALASNAGAPVPEVTAEDVKAPCIARYMALWETIEGWNEDNKLEEIATTASLESYRARLIERMNGGGE